MFIDDHLNDTDGQNAAKQKSDGQADDKETATDEKTKEKSNDQVITGNKTDSKVNATDNKTEDDDAGEHDAQEKMTVTSGQDECQDTSNHDGGHDTGDKGHVEFSRTTNIDGDEGDEVLFTRMTSIDVDEGHYDAGEQDVQGNITVTRGHDEHQHTRNEGDKEHVQCSRTTSIHRDEGLTKARCEKDFLCYLCCEKFYQKAGLRMHYSHAHRMQLDVREIADDGWPHFIHAIFEDDGKDDGDENPWMETLNDKKTKVQNKCVSGGARGGGRGRGRRRGRGKRRGKGRGQFDDVLHLWQSVDWRADVNSTEGARSRCENYKEILDDMSKSETPEDRDLCELLKTVTRTCQENSEEKSEQSEILVDDVRAGDLSQYLDDYPDEAHDNLAPWDEIKEQPLVTEEKRLKGDESSIEEIEGKGDESSIEEIELKSDESCTEMATTKTDKDTLNDAPPLAQPLEHESDESTIEQNIEIKQNKQRLLKTRIAVLKMNICQIRAEKLYINLSSEEDEDFKSDTDTTGTMNTFTDKNSDTSTSTDLDIFSFKNSGDLDLSNSTSKKDLGNGTDVEKKTKKRKSLCWICLRLKHWEKSMQESYYEDYADNESVQ